jgi:hypothetical protein
MELTHGLGYFRRSVFARILESASGPGAGPTAFLPIP